MPADTAIFRSRPVVAIFLIAALYPVVLCATAFPTPYIDIREHASWGASFPLATWKHPPLQSWVIASVAWLGARDAWGFMLAAQVINAAALWFCYRIARDFIRPDAGVPAAILIGGSAYIAGAVPTIALNGDQLQPLLWSGMIYFALRAARDDRWRDWIGFGAFWGLALLTKYFALVLVASLLIAAAAVPAYRKVFTNLRLYASGLIALAVITPHLIALRQYPEMFSFVATQFEREPTRLRGLGDFAGPALLIASPVALLALLPRTRPYIAWAERSDATRFLLATGAAFALILLAMILYGLEYSPRYSFGFAPLSALVLLCLVRVAPAAMPAMAAIFLAAWALIVPATAAYAIAVLRPLLREPSPAAAAHIIRDWNGRHRCGPAYVIGTSDAAFGVALYATGADGRRLTGISYEDLVAKVRWFDPARVTREGAILVAWDAATLAGPLGRMFPDKGPMETLTLPYRRTGDGARQPYAYAFIAPKGC